MRTASFVLTASLLTLVGCASTPAASDEPAAATAERADAPGVTLVVRGMSCPLCAQNVDKQLMAIRGVSGAEIDLGSGEIDVTFDGFGEAPTEAQLRQAIVDSGYTLESIQSK